MSAEQPLHEHAQRIFAEFFAESDHQVEKGRGDAYDDDRDRLGFLACALQILGAAIEPAHAQPAWFRRRMVKLGCLAFRAVAAVDRRGRAASVAPGPKSRAAWLRAEHDKVTGHLLGTGLVAFLRRFTGKRGAAIPPAPASGPRVTGR